MSATGDTELDPQQQRLVVEHAYVAKRVRRRYARLRAWLDKNELESIALMGVVRAARKYRREDGPFEFFAWCYAKGEVLRAVDGESRFSSVKRAVLVDMSGARREGNVMTDTAESASSELARLAQYAAGSYFMNTWRAAPHDPEEATVRAERDRVVREHVEHLSDDELRQVVELTYFEEHDLRGAAERLGLSYATVRRRHQAALRLLSAKLASADMTS